MARKRRSDQTYAILVDDLYIAPDWANAGPVHSRQHANATGDTPTES